MSFKDELNAAKAKAAAPPATGTDDIARLLRALNEDLKDEDPPHLLDEGPEDEEEPRRDRGVPVMKIAAALLAAVGIGLAVVVLDGGGEEELAPPPPLVAAVPPSAAPAPAAPAGQPEPLIARAAPPSPVAAPAPEHTTAPPPAAPPPASTATAPVTPPAAPVAPAPAPAAAPSPASTAELQAMLRAPAPKAEPATIPPARTVAPAPAPPPAAPSTRAPASTPHAASPPAAASDGRYAVQVGSFGVPENAVALQRRLAERGFGAYTLDWTDRNQRSWRVVRVGNFRTGAEARNAAEELKARMNLPAQIVTTR